MLLGFISIKTLLIIAHLFGVVFGMGGAYVSDAMFFYSLKDKKLIHTELGFLKLGSKLTWFGLVVLILSGVGLFSLNPAGYLASSKFLAKMTIVLIIAINGVVFHITHIPRMSRYTNQLLNKSKDFKKTASSLIVSGAVSFVSWSCVLILGVFHSVPYSYFTIMIAYIVVVLIAIIFGLLLKKKLLPVK